MIHYQTYMKIVPFCTDRRGVTSIEYAILASLIAVVIISSVTLLGKGVSATFNSVDTAFTAATAPAAPIAPRPPTTID
ncbi:Flp family type IVb pilin [Acidocella aquatica]|uniref:Flp family type IVb pilin n=1 Tax=Acidocella aquatica TaxID=1922313 RepID=UPI0024E0B141|nr:Flp family type IVb pilin [Acidocella aquatica]